VEKWRKENIPRKDKENISAEGQDEDGLFIPQQKGPITSTFTADWFLREGQGRELMGEWVKLTSVRSQDQRRILRANSRRTFPNKRWVISNILAKPYQQHTSMIITNVGD
jgi:hypothetical protein